MTRRERIENSHAKLAAEMREYENDGYIPVRKGMGWAARVEQLGSLPRCLCSGPMKCEKCGERWFMPGQMNKTIDEERGRVEEKKAAKARDYLDEAPHLDGCASGRFLRGRPTADGGYEMYLEVRDGTRWFRTDPVDERPACDCGLNEARALVKSEKERCT